MTREKGATRVVAPELLPADAIHVKSIASTHGVTSIRVFGSFARGEARPDSDIDLLVTLAEDRGLIALGAFVDEAERALGRLPDVTLESWLPPEIRESVIREARAL